MNPRFRVFHLGTVRCPGYRKAFLTGDHIAIDLKELSVAHDLDHTAKDAIVLQRVILTHGLLIRAIEHGLDELRNSGLTGLIGTGNNVHARSQRDLFIF